MANEIPQSNALAEAGGPESISELMGRDPLKYQRQDRDRIVEVLRADRARREALAASAAERGMKTPKAVKISQVASTATAEDLGL